MACCINASVRRVDNPMIASISRVGVDIGANVGRADNAIVASILKLSGLTAQALRADKPLEVRVGVVCSIPEELVIRFAKDKLVWEGSTNKEGVIMYNTLMATGEWSLEEIVIEELL